MFKLLQTALKTVANVFGSNGCLVTVGWRERGLGERRSGPTLPSPVIGQHPAVFAPTRCIVGTASGSPPAVGKLVLLFRCGDLWPLLRVACFLVFDGL